ncbi:hypothetical protein FRC03_002430 [Tulasnella sp. 419]|nr:hypothetical protein FRC03_002430 [Tulasnella sp. 419]
MRKHPIHYSDVLVILKVEDTLFRVDKSLLCQFDIFRDMFEGASAHLQDQEEGSTDENPIILQGLTSGEMESLLDVINARGVPKVDPQEWKNVIRLATMWEHEQLRQFAIDQIDQLALPSIELFDLGMKCRVEKWLKPALVEMCLRSSPLGLEEAGRLGTQFFVELTKIREKCLIPPQCSNCGKTFGDNCPNCGKANNPYYRTHGPFGSSTGAFLGGSVPYCSCVSDWAQLKQLVAQNMVQSLIDSGLWPLL